MTFVCKQCGTEFEGKPGESGRVFCSKQCYDKFKGQRRYFTCPHNDAVECELGKKKCNKCGWHPTIAKVRMDKLLNKGVTGNG